VVKCPHCEYEGEPSSFVFESIRADRRHTASDRGILTCPDCGVALGGYAYKTESET